MPYLIKGDNGRDDGHWRVGELLHGERDVNSNRQQQLTRRGSSPQCSFPEIRVTTFYNHIFQSVVSVALLQC